MQIRQLFFFFIPVLFYYQLNVTKVFPHNLITLHFELSLGPRHQHKAKVNVAVYIISRHTHISKTNIGGDINALLG